MNELLLSILRAAAVHTGYTLTGYYDQSVSDGGRIRVIVAREK